MKYVLFCKAENKYLSRGNMSLEAATTDITKAVMLKLGRARNYIDKSLAPQERTKWEPLPYTPEPLPIKEIDPETLNDFVTAGRQRDWIKVVNDLMALSKETQEHQNEMNSKQSDIDKEIVDIQHYIELFELNEGDGYKAYKMLQARLKERREVKNEIFIVGLILSMNMKMQNPENIIKSIKGLDNRKYDPRILKELFQRD